MLLHWLQNYDPLHNPAFSTLVAALPVTVLLALIAWGRMPIHRAATAALLLALGVSIGIYDMPWQSACMASVFGAAYALLPIGWMIVNLIFIHRLTVERGWFDVLRAQLARLAPDPRVQLILIAYCFGAFFEGTAGFGAPVAVTSALLMQLGFKPLQACGLSLIANTAPVAFGSLGIPLVTLNAVTGLDLLSLSKMAGRQLPLFSFVIPFWIVGAHSGWRGIKGVWPVALTAGLAFAVPQFLVSNYHGPWLVDIVAALCSMGAVVAMLSVWKPSDAIAAAAIAPEAEVERDPAAVKCWMPWLILCVFVFTWASPIVKDKLDGIYSGKVEIAMLHGVVERTAPVAAPVAAGKAPKREDAVLKLNVLSTIGTGIFLAAIASGMLMGFKPRRLLELYGSTLLRLRLSIMTICAMLALGYVTKYSGADATLGLALAKTGWLYPFFGALLGWLGVALTGSDTASNVLFGSLQSLTAQQVGVSPIMMASANSVGGVMGKMIDAQSIVVASTATGYYGQEGKILRFVFLHSLILAMLVGFLVMLQAYVWPFTEMVVK